MDKVTIKVKSRHIVNGKANNSAQCPIAQALKETGASDIQVTGMGYATYERGGWKYWFNLNERAKTFVRYFDQGYAVRPFQFTVEEKRG